jgi:hypothetical protein
LVVTAPAAPGNGGVISGTLQCKGKTLILKGSFGPSGEYQTSATYPDGFTLAVTLQLKLAGSSYVIGGTTSLSASLGTRFDGLFDVCKVPFSKTLPAPSGWTGSFTMLMPSEDGRLTSEPGGDGWATLKGSSDGVLSVSGVLGDGTKFTETSYLSETGEAAIYANLYKTTPERGYIGGKLVFRDQPEVSDFDGKLQWTKFADSRETIYKQRFDISVWAIGSKYVAPGKGSPALPGIERPYYNAELSLIGANAPGPVNGALERVISWLGTNELVYYGPEKLSGSATPATGQVQGSYTVPSTKAVIGFSGVVLQKQGIAGGVFVHESKAGALRILAGTDYSYPGSDDEDAGELTRSSEPSDRSVSPVLSYIPFNAAGAGTYDGTVSDGSSAVGALQNVVLSSRGAVSGTVWIDGAKQSFQGTLGIPMKASGGATIFLRLTQITGDGGYGLGGNVYPPGKAYDVTARLRPVFASGSSSPQAGSYTVLVRAPENLDTSVHPGGDGYGVLTVSAKGACTGSVTLPDGTKATMSGFVARPYLAGDTSVTEWQFHTGLYGATPRGFLAGRVTFRSVAGVSDLDGDWRWVKKSGAAPASVYGTGFDENRSVIGAKYVPVAGVQAIDGTEGKDFNVWLRWLGPDLSALPAKELTNLDRVATWTTGNAFVYYGPEKVSLSFNARTGILTGSYLDDINKVNVTFGGALLQTQKIFSGSYVTLGKSGLFAVEPR